ncbi:low affinity Fe/Cu permease [Pseudomonas nitritireducens]|uniref:Low affinity Fe/Cu permease n=1 Tax=Pseudomonas nitroreducens TaxID=46680 RepID=A0A7W7KG36_PSENT|nr:low affinity Fe/Cu permease [Pseudomonas nitritireducens]
MASEAPEARAQRPGKQRPGDRQRPGERRTEQKSPAEQQPSAPPHGGAGFSRFAQALSQWAGRPLTFALACVLLVGWALSGPFFHFNDTWQLVINTSTTIITFLMVFLIQSTQNRDTDALHIKIDELLRTTHHAHRVLMGLDDMGSEELQKLRKTYEEMGEDNAGEGSPQSVANREERQQDGGRDD